MPNSIDGVSCAHRATQHIPARFPLLYMMYHRDYFLPVDIEYIFSSEPTDLIKSFNKESFVTLLNSTNKVKQEIFEAAISIIKNVQENQIFVQDHFHLPFQEILCIVIIINIKTSDFRRLILKITISIMQLSFI